MLLVRYTIDIPIQLWHNGMTFQSYIFGSSQQITISMAVLFLVTCLLLDSLLHFSFFFGNIDPAILVFQHMLLFFFETYNNAPFLTPFYLVASDCSIAVKCMLFWQAMHH